MKRRRQFLSAVAASLCITAAAGTRLIDAPALQRPSSRACPCRDPSLCERVQGGKGGREVLAFRGNQDSDWRKYDWDTLTGIAWFVDDDVMCHAHSKKVRAYLPADRAWNAVDSNATARAEWISLQVSAVRDRFMDGLMFDVEDKIAPLAEARALYTALVRETAAAFHSLLPGSRIGVALGWTPYDADGRNYDVVGLAEAADHIFIMSYDLQSQVWTHGCLASATSPAKWSLHGLQQFIEVGVPPEKLIYAPAWTGYAYPCVGQTDPELADLCPMVPMEFVGAPCSDLAGLEIDNKEALWILAANGSTARRFDPITETPFFNAPVENWRWDAWRKNWPEGSSVFQVWYDDAQSLRIKYERATALAPRLGGLGVWHLDSVSYDDDGDDADLAAETGRRLRALLREFSATTNRGGDNKQGGAGAGAYQTT